MVHELLGVNNNRVRLKGTASARGDPNLDEVAERGRGPVLRPAPARELRRFGHGRQAALDDYQRQTKLNENIKSIDDMQPFQFRIRRSSKSTCPSTWR